MKAKKLTASLCALLITLSGSISCFAAQTSSPTPESSKDVKEAWHATYKSAQGWNACGTPVIGENMIYVTENSGVLHKLDGKTGKLLASAPCEGVPLFFSMPAYGEQKVFVPVVQNHSVKISAFSANDLKLLWTASAVEGTNLQSESIYSPALYTDGMLVFGTTHGKTGGNLVCMNTQNGKVIWKHENKKASYYWSGVCHNGNTIFVSDTEGNLSAYNIKTGELLDSISLGENVKSTPCFSNGTVYVSGIKGNLYSVKFNKKFSEKKSVKLGNNLTSSPEVYNGRLYVAGGGNGANTPFSVVDANTLKIIYQIKDIKSQSTPLVSTAYASKKNGNEVLVYVANYVKGSYPTFDKGSSCVYVIHDKQGQTAPNFQVLTNVSAPQYCSQSLCADKNGTMFFYNDSGNLFALAPLKKTVPSNPEEKSKPESTSKPNTIEKLTKKESKSSANTDNKISKDQPSKKLSDVSAKKNLPTGDLASGAAVCAFISLACIATLKKKQY